MKTIKIFLASSIEDLESDRDKIGDFIRQIDEEYLKRNIHISLIKCEDYDNSIAANGKQQEFDNEIRESELVFFLFFRKVGEYTRHELDVAMEAFRSQNRPKVITYFKYVDNAGEIRQEVRDFMQLLDQELKHYYNRYNHIDTLKLGIMMQLRGLQLGDVQVSLEDEALSLNGRPMVKVKNVPMLRENKPLQELSEKRRQLMSDLQMYRKVYLANATEEAETNLFETKMALDAVSKQLTAAKKEIMELLTTVAEMTADGRILTHRQKEALKHFEMGDYTAVRAILDDRERENELLRARQQAEMAKNEIRGYVEEELLLIKTERALGLTEEKVREILGRYEKLEGLVYEYSLDRSVLLEYASFLWLQNLPERGIKVAQKLLSDSAEDTDKAGTYMLLGALYQTGREFTKAKEAYKAALQIYLRKEPGAWGGEIAACYSNLITLYGAGEQGEAEKACCKALGIFKDLTQQNPYTHERALAGCYTNMGDLYHMLLRSGNAEKAGSNAEKAKEAYAEAMAVCRRLAERDQKRYGPDLAASCYNRGQLFKDIAIWKDGQEAYEEAETAFCEAEASFHEALERYLCLAAENPGAYEPSLAECYSGIGSLHDRCWRYGEQEAALKAYEKAFDILQHLAGTEPERYEIQWNELFWRYVEIHAMQDRGKLPLPILRRALPLYEKLAAKDPEVYGEGLAFVRQSLSEE